MKYALTVLFIFFLPAAILANERLEVHFIDVGQGDSTLIRSPSGRTMLIDAGENDQKAENYLKAIGVGKIDILLATHPHLDHIGGLPRIIRGFEIGSIIMPRASANTKTFQNLLESIRDKGLKIQTAKPGMAISFDPVIQVECLAPNNEKYEDMNDYSVVLKMTYGKMAILFTGDATKVSESEMLQIHRDKLRSHILKVSHHGSSSSSTQAFIDAVSPMICFISCGENNKFGHPTQPVLNRFAGKEVYRTDQQGTVVMVSNGQQYAVKPTKAAKILTAPVSPANTANSETYYVTPSGTKYHRQSCRYAGNVRPVSREEATGKYTPCTHCNP